MGTIIEACQKPLLKRGHKLMQEDSPFTVNVVEPRTMKGFDSVWLESPFYLTDADLVTMLEGEHLPLQPTEAIKILADQIAVEAPQSAVSFWLAVTRQYGQTRWTYNVQYLNPKQSNG